MTLLSETLVQVMRGSGLPSAIQFKVTWSPSFTIWSTEMCVISGASKEIEKVTGIFVLFFIRIFYLFTTRNNEIFRSIRGTCHENKLREFRFIFIHRIIVSRKELFRFKIKEDSHCFYCGKADSIDHSFINCQFTMSFTQEVLQWFNATHNSTFNPNTEEILFGLPTATNVIKKKLDYTLLFLRYYIYR